MLKSLSIPAVLTLSGCGGLGVDLSDDRTIAIQKSPYLIVATGDLTHQDATEINRILSFLSTQPYQDDNFSAFQIGIRDVELVTNAKNIDIQATTKESE